MENTAPLKGIRVVELASIVAAPTAGRLLADYGADVIKVETPGMGDGLRMVGAMNLLPIDKGNCPLFDEFNTGKKLTAINLKSSDGMEYLYKLLETADVFISNTRMQSLDKLGLGYEALHERFPKLIYAHFSGFGLHGPDKNRPGYDITAFWMRAGSVLDMVEEGCLPARPAYAFGDIATASYFLNGILIALLGRETSGIGTLVETSLYNCGIWMNSVYVLNTQPKYGNVLPYDRYEPWNPFSDCFLCKDGVWIAPLTKNYFKERKLLSEIFDLPELMEDEDCANIAVMKKVGKEPQIMRRLEAVIAEKTSAEWKEIFEQADIAYEIVRHSKEVYQDEQARANGYIEDVIYPDGPTAVPVPPFKLSEYNRRSFERMGQVGLDTDSILSSLGYSIEKIAQMKADRSVQ